MNQSADLSPSQPLRRPLKSRNTRIAAGFARWLTDLGISPNEISVVSIVFAGVTTASFLALDSGFIGSGILLVLAAVGIQLRLLCNLMDGMVAVEGSRKTKTGELYNEFPDRIADLLILVGAGYALREYPFAIELGWLAGSLAVLTAYCRALAGSAGAKQHFVGPMAKPHRMAAMTVACLAAAVELALVGSVWLLYAGLAVVVVGSFVTLVRRLMIAAEELEAA
jgi:phosphatidylglycerophosphate synthase